MGLLLDLEGRRIAQARQRVGRLLADEAVELSLQAIDPGDVLLLGRQ